MLKLQPVKEKDAGEFILPIYQSIKKNFSVGSIPLIFQYLDCFPLYLGEIWQQIEPNLKDKSFRDLGDRLLIFSQNAIAEIYEPSPAIGDILIRKLAEKEEKQGLINFVTNISSMNGSLYLLSL